MPVNKIQSSRRAKAAIAGAGAVGAVALASVVLIQPWEGRSLVAYRDIVGVLTICDGDTANVRPGMKVTPAECDRRTAVRVRRDYFEPLKGCIFGFEKRPISWQASMISLAYNIGTGAACNSSAARLARLGKLRESCEAATAFNKAGGKTVPGLVKRREMGDATRIGEAELCVSGL
ncbi:Phage-related lysozyme (muramidase), GH24 family [Kaistia soli DSM 19436]|uniref:Lysozyme n=1 Tax=Kaistia soli DSM 19436 TaxID=1122133 RepID=A0A1M4YKP5_9HYPH|nr:lysozyme [Kaistia soli]SHF06320.1 Phage-related lysozyme (muramidase), GH24 family [Kaistia soli DSM 19436]